MAGTKSGGYKTQQTLKKRYGAGYYVGLGALGAAEYKKRQAAGVARPRGFQADPELARRAALKSAEARKENARKKQTSSSSKVR